MKAFQPHYDVIVVGAGAMGTATAWKVASAGATVLLVDQSRIGNTRGSSHGESRIYRQAYFEHPDYVPLLKEAWDDWRAMQGVFNVVGALYVGPENSELITGSRFAASQFDLPLGPLHFDDPRGKVIEAPRDWASLFEPTGAVIHPERATRWMADAAQRAGADIAEDTKVLAWVSDVRGTSIETDQGSYSCDKLVLCGGPWTAKLIEGLPVELVVTRQTAHWFVAPLEDLDRLAQMPVFGIQDEQGTFVYGFPADRETGLFKIANHTKGVTWDANMESRASRPDDDVTVRPALTRFFGGDDWQVAKISVCLYTNTPDGHFLFDRVPETENAYFIGGTSGHGFKFAPVLGAAMADVVLTGTTARPIGFLSLARFGR